MPLINDFKLPEHLGALSVSSDTLLILFTTSDDPATGESWCPDVRAAQPVLKTALEGPDSPLAAVVEVGQKVEWKDPNNAYRTKWDVKRIPTLIRYHKVGDKFEEDNRLAEEEILDEEKLKALVRN